METVDLQELKEAAELVIAEDGRGSQFALPCSRKHFCAKATPAAILSLIAEVKSLRAAYATWVEKTEFVQTMAHKGELDGKYLDVHRADILKKLIESLRKQLEEANEARHFNARMCVQLQSELTALRSSRDAVIERAIRLACNEYRTQAMAYPGANVDRVLPAVLAQLKEQK